MKPVGFTWLAMAILATGSSLCRADAPAVDIVVGDTAPRLERFAAQELAGQLKTLFGARAAISDKTPAQSNGLILLGSPATNPAVKTWAGGHWPKLTEQGHLLRSVSHEGRKALLVGGGSPVATLWAVYELGHHFGMRYLSRSDMPPADPPAFKLDGIEMILEPTFRVRGFQGMDASPIGLEAWSLADHKKLLRQMAKLKFNQVYIPLHPWQPFTALEIAGAKKRSAVLFSGKRFPVDAETAGRTAFPAEATEFENPDFVGRTTPKDRTQVGQSLVRSLIETAHELGMEVGLAVSKHEFDQEYSAKFAPKKIMFAGFDLNEPASLDMLTGTDLRGRASTWSRPNPGRGNVAHEKTYAWPSVRRLVKDRALWFATSSDNVVVLPLEGDGVLPQLATQSVHDFLKRIHDAGKAGYFVQFNIPADQDPCLHYLARASCDPKMTPHAAYEDYINAIWGEGVAERLIKGFDKLEEAVNVLDAGDPGFAELDETVVMKHYKAKGPAPAYLAKARDLYGEAMDEMYRANQRARKVAHEPLFYHSKRLEFAVSYLSALEPLYLAAQAREKGNAKEQFENLEKATETMFNGLAAQGEVSHDSSNLGVLAVLNEYGYRPLKAELERVEKVAKGK